MIKLNKHINIPIFIPHLGCPNNCVFCNQRIISGTYSFSPESVIPIIDDSLSTAGENSEIEIAFFGGSFTGIDRDLMIKLLEIANHYLISGRISSIRCSTRPDYINDEILEILKHYGVRTVELGLQSVSENVLSVCSRGHDFMSESIACNKIKESGLKLGGQMMIGLPASTLEDEIKTAEFIVASGADEARIYPTIVFKDTELYAMTEKGEYAPLDLEDAVIRAAKVFAIFVRSGIKVLRIGLCDSENLHNDTTYFAGPNHPAMGELVEGEYYYNLIRDKIERYNIDNIKNITLVVAKGHTSRVIGQNKKNKIRLLRQYSIDKLSVMESNLVPEYDILLKVEERK